jgi:hypothetical protein
MNTRLTSKLEKYVVSSESKRKFIILENIFEKLRMSLETGILIFSAAQRRKHVAEMMPQLLKIYCETEIRT